MPALDRASVEAWLRAHEPGAAHAITGEIEADDMPSVLAAVIGLGHALDRARARDPGRLGGVLRQPAGRAGLRTVLGHLGAARRVRLLHWLCGAGLPERHLVMAGLLADEPGIPPGADAGRVVREAVRRLNRGALLARLFSPERVARLLSVCAVEEGAPCAA